MGILCFFVWIDVSKDSARGLDTTEISLRMFMAFLLFPFTWMVRLTTIGGASFYSVFSVFICAPLSFYAYSFLGNSMSSLFFAKSFFLLLVSCLFIVAFVSVDLYQKQGHNMQSGVSERII